MANVRDIDISLWLHNKLGTTNDTWSSAAICSQLNPEVLRNIKDCFPDLQTQVKLKLLLSLFQIPRRNLDEWRPQLEDIIRTARNDSELWVEMLAEIMKSYPSTGSLNLEIVEIDESRAIFSDLLNDLRNLLKKQSCETILLPLECLYLNKAALKVTVGQQSEVTKHFSIRKKPKSAYLRVELLQKSHDAATNLKKTSAPVIPVRTRGMPRKMTDTTPLKGLPSRTLNSSFGRTLNNSINRTNVPRNPATRKDGGIKFLDINEQPLGYQQMKKRKKIMEAEEAKKVNEQQQQHHQQQNSVVSGTLGSTSSQISASTVPNFSTSDIGVYKPLEHQPQGSTLTPDYAAGLNTSLSYAPPTPQPNLVNKETPIIINQSRIIGLEDQQIATEQKPILLNIQNSNLANNLTYSQEHQHPHQQLLHHKSEPEEVLRVNNEEQQQVQLQNVTNLMGLPQQSNNVVNNISRKGIVLTKEQMLEAQEMFRTANKVTRPEKALILGFMAGARDNPCPHLGSMVTIKLSESQENVLQSDQVTYLPMTVESHFQMNFNNGEWKRMKRYRTLNVPDVRESTKIEPWKVTNGSFLMQNIGQRVSIVGVANSSKSNASMVEITTTDSLVVNVTFKKPCTVDNESYIEVHGIVQSRNSILCDRLIQLPSLADSKLDTNAYNQLVIFLNTFNDTWATE